MTNNETNSETLMKISKFGETHSYFTKSVLPSSMKAHKYSVSMPNSYIHNQDNTFILVTSGTGTLTVNGLEYRLEPDTLVSLGCFHVYRFTPDEGEVLKITEARINNGAYLYLIANPYYKVDKFSVPSEPPILKVSGLMKEIAYEAMEGLCAECTSDNVDKYNMCYCYITDLFAIVNSPPRSKKRKS